MAIVPFGCGSRLKLKIKNKYLMFELNTLSLPLFLYLLLFRIITLMRQIVSVNNSIPDKDFWVKTTLIRKQDNHHSVAEIYIGSQIKTKNKQLPVWWW
jgi:hypothetical protein